jgi:ADP-ribosylglycohydrolase
MGLSELERARGMLYGLACGDALGAPTEFMRLPAIKQAYGPAGIRNLPEPALYTDDTQMAVALAEALVEAGEADLETLMSAVVRNFIAWRNSPENNRAPGNTCMAAVAVLEEGRHWSVSGVARSKGSGSAMRSAPVGYLYQRDPARLREVAHASGIATHRHPTGDAACIAAAYLVKLALDGLAPGKMLGATLAFVGDISDEFNQALWRVPDVLVWADEEAALSALGQGWVGEEAVALALYCFLRYPDDYAAVVRRAANTEGDSDSIACIAGAISGARLGDDAIPADWLARVEKSDYLADLAGRLAAKKVEMCGQG